MAIRTMVKLDSEAATASGDHPATKLSNRADKGRMVSIGIGRHVFSQHAANNMGGPNLKKSTMIMLDVVICGKVACKTLPCHPNFYFSVKDMTSHCMYNHSSDFFTYPSDRTALNGK